MNKQVQISCSVNLEFRSWFLPPRESEPALLSAGWKQENLTAFQLDFEQAGKGRCSQQKQPDSAATSLPELFYTYTFANDEKTGRALWHMNSSQWTTNWLPRLQIIPDVGISTGEALDKCTSSASRDRFGSSIAACLQNTACAWINSFC